MKSSEPQLLSQQDQLSGLLNWLFHRGLKPWDVESLQGALVTRLIDMGVPISRMHIGMPTLHPLYAIGTYNWEPDTGVQTSVFGRGTAQSIDWLQSPIHPLYESGDDARRFILEQEGSATGYPMLERMKADGVSEYFVQLAGFDDRTQAVDAQEGVVTAWSTRAAGGFSDDAIVLLQTLHLPLCLLLKSLAQRQLTQNILDTYLGSYSGNRVLSGQIQRGDSELIDAVVFFCDLRSSSSLAEAEPPEGFLELLNQYFEVTAGTVSEYGGEVLRFIGDAALGIFPFERFDGAHEACRVALAASQEALHRGRLLNQQRQHAGQQPIGFGIGLHPGSVFYGNIGTPTRLEFTVIGRAANEAARIESQCKELGEPLLVSDDFVKLLPGGWRSQGTFDLRNIDRPVEIFSPGKRV